MAGDIPISMSRTDTKAPPLDHSIARIHRPDGSIAGGGLMVGPRTVLTCAHVIERALGADLVRAAAVALTFPLLPHQPADADKIAARVSVLFPAQLDRTGDIAVLTLETEPPAGAEPARLTAERRLWGHSCRLFGFSDGHDDGVWVAGVLRAEQAAGWVQLECAQIAGYAVEPGFSGTPVWDDQLGAVVGIAVAAEVHGHVRAAYMLPVSRLAQAWPPLTRQVACRRRLPAPMCRRVVTVLAVLSLAAGLWTLKGWASEPSDAAGQPSTGLTRVIRTFNDKCVDVPKPADGTPLRIMRCDGSVRQMWEFEGDGTVHNGLLCMDVAWGATSNGTRVQVAACNDGRAQKLEIKKDQLVNTGLPAARNKCVDVEGGRDVAGAALDLWDCTGTSGQRFTAASS